MPYRLNGSFLSSCLSTARAPDRRDEVASSRSRPRLRTKAYHIPLDACCTAANLGWQCPLWVISVISKRGTDVGFTPKSGHQSGRDRCPLCAISDQSALQQNDTLFDHL